MMDNDNKKGCECGEGCNCEETKSGCNCDTECNCDETKSDCDCGPDCDCGCQSGKSDEDMEEESIITLVDEETGESFEFAYVDSFEFNDKSYCVLLTMDEEPEMVIAQEVEDENGDITISTLEEEEEDAVFDFYDKLCEESMSDEESEE
ncbi:MAG: DUF1292 domain-containing protein [Clostridiaceae bacterium]|nr:DUF1292 domain-containing protein [Clostridiaceae bacterium]